MIFSVMTKRNQTQVGPSMAFQPLFSFQNISGGNESSHEARLASIAEQISLLEEENVGPRDWTLMGEATSRKRPHNSLLEQDLDFEHVQRPVSTVTVEQINSVEDLIKKRILEVSDAFSLVTLFSLLSKFVCNRTILMMSNAN